MCRQPLARSGASDGDASVDPPTLPRYVRAIVRAELHRHGAGAKSWSVCLDPRAMLWALVRHRELLFHLVRRNVAGRYRGSFLGVGWTVLQPLLLLAVYTFVFAVVFKARWHADGASHAEFALVVFCGLIPFNFLAETANQAPNVVLQHPNYVTRVVFPLEILPVVAVGTALTVAAVNTGVLLVALVVVRGVPPPSVLLIPVVAVPCVLLALGMAWALAMLGVFVRDTASVVAFLTQVAFFATPIVYPADSVPETWRLVLRWNPLVVLVDAWRGIALHLGAVPWSHLAVLTAISGAVAVVGRAVFVRAERAFADVL